VIPLLLAPLLAKLAQEGLSTLGNAILAKGKDVVEEKLGVKIPDDPAKLTPALLQQLQIRTMEHEEFLLTAGIQKVEEERKQFEAEAADRGNARDRDKEFIKAGRNNVRGDWLAYLAVGALVADIAFLSLIEVPKTNRDLLLVVLGALITIVKDVYGFEFGSSKGSERNAQAVSDMLKNGG
jgi:hypothetical protein